MLDLVIRDATHKQRAYRGLAIRCAELGDAWLAVHGQLASDLAALTVLCGAANVDAGEMGSLASRGILARAAEIDTAGWYGYDALTTARVAALDELPADTAEEWQTVWGDPAPFEMLGPVVPHDLLTAHSGRFASGSIDVFVAERTQVALEAHQRGNELLRDGLVWDAVLSFYASDLALYESWLFARAHSAGDPLLTGAELQWRLGVAALEQLAELPVDPMAARFTVRSRLAWALGPVQATEFAAALRNLGV